MKSGLATYISRHQKYIDYRTAIIGNYVLLNKLTEADKIRFLSNIISNLTALQNREKDSIPANLSTPVQELKNLLNTWDLLLDGDILGYIYQKLSSKFFKRKLGQFFTPPDVVTHIINASFSAVNFLQTPVILDPACGSGQFLISSYRKLSQEYINARHFRSRYAEKIMCKHIYGFDIDPVSLEIARYNLSRISGIDPEAINLFQLDFLNRNQLPVCNVTAFDIICGNPPWGAKLSTSEKAVYRMLYNSPQSGINSFTLFIERSTDFLKENGVVSFLVPEAYLNIKAHESSRILISSNYLINEIALWGEKFRGVFAPSVSFIFKKPADKSNLSSNIIQIIKSPDRQPRTATLVPQKSYDNNPERIFNINYSRKAINVMSKISSQDCFYLDDDNSKFFLGIVTGNNGRHISDFRTLEHPDPIIVGRDITKYRIKISSRYFKFNPDALQQTAPFNLYKTANKLLYKFIGKDLTFAIDREGNFSLNNVNGIIPHTDKMNIETLAAVLNSRIMQYYYQKHFFTVKVLKGNIERLPIKQISARNQTKIRKLVNEISTSEDQTASIVNTIDDIIFSEYGINDREASKLIEGSETMTLSENLF